LDIELFGNITGVIEGGRIMKERKK